MTTGISGTSTTPNGKVRINMALTATQYALLINVLRRARGDRRRNDMGSLDLEQLQVLIHDSADTA